MDGELIFWILVFVGGYAFVLGLLLWVAFRSRPDDAAARRADHPHAPP